MFEDMGMRIREQRRHSGLSQQELADMLGVKQYTVSKYENNVKLPSLEVLVMLADIFDISTDYLLGRVKYYT